MPHLRTFFPSSLFDRPPVFNHDERKCFFTPPTELLPIISRAVGFNKIGLILQHGYFKPTGKFYKSEKYQKADIYYVAKLLKLKFTGVFIGFVRKARSFPNKTPLS